MTSNRNLTIVLFVLSAVSTWGAGNLNWLNKTHRFGTIREEDGKVSCVYKAINIGDEPVVILDARANCGCTRPSYNKEPIMPGDTLSVSVTFDPAGRPGRFNKQVKITTNITEQKNHTLSIRGTVIGAINTLKQRYPVEVGNIRISNDVSLFGETRKGRVLAAAINIYNPTSDTIKAQVKNLPSYINALFSPTYIAPGEQGSLSMTAYTDRCSSWGLVEDGFQLIPDSKHPEHVANISTAMTINENFSHMTEEQLAKAPKTQLSTETLDFGKFNKSNGTISKSFKITNKGASTLLIRRIYSTNKAVNISTADNQIKSGKSINVTVSINPQLLIEDDLLNANIFVITNDPNNATQAVRAVGSLIP